MTTLQRIKDYLVNLGPGNAAVRSALRLHGLRRGFAVRFVGGKISICRGARQMLLAEKDFYLVPITLECFDQTFEEIEPSLSGHISVLDFSRPGAHRYRRHGLTLSFPGAPEDDSIAAYTHWYKPKPGDLVLDVGAHAGFTTCAFARMVQPGGRVIAFEPDPASVEYLQQNLAALEIANVTVVRKAINSRTGIANFNADGTMGAGLVDHSVYGHTGREISVETLSLSDACAQFGMPQFIKMDIEGAEIGVIESSTDFLRTHPTNLAFDSYTACGTGASHGCCLSPYCDL